MSSAYSEILWVGTVADASILTTALLGTDAPILTTPLEFTINCGGIRGHRYLIYYKFDGSCGAGTYNYGSHLLASYSLAAVSYGLSTPCNSFTNTFEF